MWHQKIVEMLSKFDEEIIPTVPPENLPLLDEMRKSFPDNEAFTDVDVLFIQRHLGPFVPRLKAMFAS
jgi:hypothetical protein